MANKLGGNECFPITHRKGYSRAPTRIDSLSGNGLHITYLKTFVSYDRRRLRALSDIGLDLLLSDA